MVISTYPVYRGGHTLEEIKAGLLRRGCHIVSEAHDTMVVRGEHCPPELGDSVTVREYTLEERKHAAELDRTDPGAGERWLRSLSEYQCTIR